MTGYQKFMFDNFVLDDKPEEEIAIAVPETDTAVTVPDGVDNSEEENAEVIQPVIQGYTDEEVNTKLKLAETAAYQKGMEDAKASEESETERMLQKIDKALVKALGDYSAARNGMEQQFRRMAAALLEKLVPVLEQEHAVELVNRFLEENFSNFSEEAKLSFYVHPDIIGKVQETIGRLAHVTDFEGKITLHKDAALGISDCRVEWENGGVERNAGDLKQKAAELLEIKQD